MLSVKRQLADIGPPGQHGLAELELEQRAGRTRLTRVRTRPPLLVQQALYPDAGAPDLAHVLLANPTGGLLEGDRQEISVTVGPGARAHVTTQSATKIHTMTHGQAEQRVALSVGRGGYLEYLPDPLIPFRNAKLVQNTIITVESGAALVYGDVITPGRVAGGEAFEYRKISSRLAVFRQLRHAVYREAFNLAPASESPMGLAILGSADPSGIYGASWHTFASILVLCDAELASAVLDLVRASCVPGVGADTGVSLLPDGNGVGVKIVGADRSAVQSAATGVWSAARRQLIGAPRPDLRKY